MLSALSVSLGGDAAGTRRAEQSLERQGFVSTLRFAWQDVSLQGWSKPDVERSDAARADDSVRTADGFACAVGPLWYRGKFGADALRLLLGEIAAQEPRTANAPDSHSALSGRIDVTQLRGSFALFMQCGDEAWLFNDTAGLVQLYASEDQRFHSTSWLAARACVGGDEIDDDAAIEYVLQGASHSQRTVAAGVGKLVLGHAIDLKLQRSQPWLEPDAWATDAAFVSLDDAVDSLALHLRSVFAEIASAFPGRTRAALSGGFDSRLIVAGLLEQGERPDLFVYGDAGSDDVAIARAVASAEGLRLDAVDKSAMNREFRLPDVEELVRSGLFFDGLPNDGIYDPGADRRTRLAQSADGHIALNGGGGEIFRNFFHLPDRRFNPANVVRAFYRGFDTRVFRRPRALGAYQQRIAESIARSVGGAGADERLTRAQLERVYPLFRCHHWMGLNNSLAVRVGFFTTPLVDLQTVRTASALPLSWKNAGLLQSRLIDALHPGIARHRSSYGFRFSEGPDRRVLRSDWATRMRPVFARPLINATRRRLQRVGVSPDLLARCRQLFPGEWQVDRLLDLERLPDDGAFERALSIEVVSRELAP